MWSGLYLIKTNLGLALDPEVMFMTNSLGVQ